MRIVVCSLILLCVSFELLSQDSLVRFKELTFSSPFEKRTFERFRKKEVDLFSLFMANGNLLSDEKITAQRARFYDYVRGTGYDKTAGKKNDKRIKLVYDKLHGEFLSKYIEKNRFEEVFYNGNFNCVSATALYALAFEELKIPYTIKEQPSHVYLVAWPRDEQIVLQTTTPAGGYTAISNEFKMSFVRNLKDHKMISNQEFASRDNSALFDEYYFGKNSDIRLLDLAGLQYVNDALYKCEEKQFEAAFIQLEKAYMLYPSERVIHLLVYSGAHAFDTRKLKDSTHAVLLAKLSRYKSYGIDPDVIVSEFGGITQKLLFDKGKKEQYRQYFNTVVGGLQDIKLRTDISFIYYYENARLFYNQAKFGESLAHIEEALALKPTHADAQSLFLGALGQHLSSKGRDREVVDVLEKYTVRFPELEANNHFNAMKGTAYLFQFHLGYGTNKIADGDRYRGLFEAIIDKYPDMVINPDLIGQSYSMAAVYYYRKGQVAKARQLISTGLKYAPNNYELIARQQMIR
ncbi:MAG TPA: hypothetical protein VD816_12630 [Ohtaekwangia sp.]|nr:hypothetical protein [Ohtaekwangia sp.]